MTMMMMMSNVSNVFVDCRCCCCCCSVSAGVAIRIAADTVAAVSHLLSICVLVFIPVTHREIGYAAHTRKTRSQ